MYDMWDIFWFPKTEWKWVDKLYYCSGCNIISIFGIVGNIFSIIILYPSKYSKTKGLFYGYLTALAVADLLFLLSTLVFRFVSISIKWKMLHFSFLSNFKCFGYFKIDKSQTKKEALAVLLVDLLHVFKQIFGIQNDKQDLLGIFHRTFWSYGVLWNFSQTSQCHK